MHGDFNMYVGQLEKEMAPYVMAAEKGAITSQELEKVFERKYEELTKFLEKDVEQRSIEKEVLCPDCFSIKGSKNCCRNMKKYRQFPDPFSEPISNPEYRLAQAMMEARKISLREHIKADRFERVGHFTTCIRREFCRSGIGQVLSNKSLWYDIGRLEVDATVPYNPLGLNIEKIKEWIRMAEKMIPQEEFEIENALANLNGCIRGANLGVSDASRINTEASEVLDSLKKVLQES